MSTFAHDAPGRRAEAFKLLAAVVGVVATVALGLALPGLGLVLGVAIGLIAYRHEPAKRNGFILLGVVVTVVAVLLAVGALTHSGPSRAHVQQTRVIAPR